MIVWGGDVGSVSVLNDGGIYFHHPLFGEHWDPPPSAVALGPRVYHSANWVGGRMVVFGGADQTHIWGDGAAFNPVGNTWTLLPATNAPSARYRHTSASLADGSVAVWGGFGNGTDYADGARYAVAGNTWTPMAPSGLAGRRQLEATWTGQEMLVWGGFSPSGAFGDGARYNFGFDAWTPMSTLGAPSPRYDHRAGQAGDEMLIWGGSSNTDTGGRYCASCAVLDGFEAAKDLAFTSKTTLAWSANVGVTSYALYRGTFDGTTPLNNHTCFQPGLGTPNGTDPASPVPGSGYYYLVGASNGCSRTHLGQRTGGAFRTNPACP